MFDIQSQISDRPQGLPMAAGVGYKPQHYADLTADPGQVAWFEIHAENYMGDGGRPLAQLRHLAERFAISAHGVGLSIGGEAPLDLDHLKRLKQLNNWLQPSVFSEHLAWSSHDGGFLNDLLPLPYNTATLHRVSQHVEQLQDALQRQILLENPSSYLAFANSTWSEPDFLSEIVRRSGCGLLLDVNNVFVSASNLSFSPQAYIDALPLESVGEIHLGGHDCDNDAPGDVPGDVHGTPLLIDSHGRPVADPVWALLDYTLARSGPRPVLIEWDNDLPDWATLEREARRASTALSKVIG